MSDHELQNHRILLPGAELNGHMPLRSDFDVEFDDDAELLVAEMEFRPAEDATGCALKHRILQIYDGKIQERDRRKCFISGHGLLKIQYVRGTKRSRYESTVISHTRVFSRFQAPEKHETLMKGLVEAKQLSGRL